MARKDRKSVYLPLEDHIWLKTEASRRGIGMAEMIRIMLHDLDKEK